MLRGAWGCLLSWSPAETAIPVVPGLCQADPTGERKPGHRRVARCGQWAPGRSAGGSGHLEGRLDKAGQFLEPGQGCAKHGSRDVVTGKPLPPSVPTPCPRSACTDLCLASRSPPARPALSVPPGLRFPCRRQMLSQPCPSSSSFCGAASSPRSSRPEVPAQPGPPPCPAEPGWRREAAGSPAALRGARRGLGSPDWPPTLAECCPALGPSWGSSSSSSAPPTSSGSGGEYRASWGGGRGGGLPKVSLDRGLSPRVTASVGTAVGQSQPMGCVLPDLGSPKPKPVSGGRTAEGLGTRPLPPQTLPAPRALSAFGAGRGLQTPPISQL